ncbi:MAG: hypothetical protein R2761_31220 [Acidimicrobiales bacterium]
MATSDAMFQQSSPSPSGRRLNVEIAAYVRLAFNDEVELNGWIGEDTIVGESRRTLRRLSVEAMVAEETCRLTFRLRRLRPYVCTGRVMGQEVRGSATVTARGMAFEGHAGLEPLRYQISTSGTCTAHGQDLGIRAMNQSFYSEILGSVDRTPDAVMIAMLIPLLLRQRDTLAY